MKADSQSYNVSSMFALAVDMVNNMHSYLQNTVRSELNIDLNAQQIMTLYGIHAYYESGTKKALRPSDICQLGIYRGSNPSYNLKQLTTLKFITTNNKTRDKRSHNISLTESGRNVGILVTELLAQADQAVKVLYGINQEDLKDLSEQIVRTSSTVNSLESGSFNRFKFTPGSTDT